MPIVIKYLGLCEHFYFHMNQIISKYSQLLKHTVKQTIETTGRWFTIHNTFRKFKIFTETYYTKRKHTNDNWSVNSAKYWHMQQINRRQKLPHKPLSIEKSCCKQRSVPVFMILNPYSQWKFLWIEFLCHNNLEKCNKFIMAQF